MIEDVEIWGCAAHYVNQYGEAAGLEAAMKADEAFERGDLECQALWLRILDHIVAIETASDCGSVQ